ncbi:MAG: GNAT family N-acetyltransferase, partial [Phototrophicaceae bacterium]
LHSLQEMIAPVELQKSYWGDDGSAVIPAHMLFSIAVNGGQVIAAKSGDDYVGVLIGLLGIEADKPLSDESVYVYSKRMVVAESHRSKGLGYRLKMAQREFALAQGIKRVIWTFDPLLAPNAHLNIHKLGGISRQLRVNYYGTDNTGGLSPMGSSDRLYVEWLITDAAVNARANDHFAPQGLWDYQAQGAKVVNPTTVGGDGFIVPIDMIPPLNEPRLLVEIPRDYTTITQQNSQLAYQWRDHSRHVLSALLNSGYVVRDFLNKAEYDGRTRAFYYLEKQFTSQEAVF